MSIERNGKLPAQPAHPVRGEASAPWWLAELPTRGEAATGTDQASDDARSFDPQSCDASPKIALDPDGGGFNCPDCHGRNLADDPDGIRCVDCDQIAFIDFGDSLVRVDADIERDEYQPLAERNQT